MEVREVSESHFSNTFLTKALSSTYLICNSQVEVERKTAEDQPSPLAKVSEVSATKAEKQITDEPSASAQVCSERTFLTETKLSSLNKTNLLSFFQAQSQPLNLLEAFQKHTLTKHLKCFRQWQKIRRLDLSELSRILDIPEKRSLALNLEAHIQAMFPT